VKKRFRNLIGPQVRALRWKRGLTQEALATRLQVFGAAGLDRGKLAKIESQIRSVFDYELLAISHVLGVSPGYLAPTEKVLVSNLPRLSAWDDQENRRSANIQTSFAERAKNQKTDAS
jgi:transcriptional regulator with XRE-family HTH domain